MEVDEAATQPQPPRPLARDVEDKTFKNLDYFNNMTHDDLFDVGNNTFVQIPRPLRSGCLAFVLPLLRSYSAAPGE